MQVGQLEGRERTLYKSMNHGDAREILLDVWSRSVEAIGCLVGSVICLVEAGVGRWRVISKPPLLFTIHVLHYDDTYGSVL